VLKRTGFYTLNLTYLHCCTQPDIMMSAPRPDSVCIS